MAELETRDGAKELVLVHIEVQLRHEVDFGARMFQYYALLWLRYRKPIWPIVVYLRGGGGDGLGEEAYDVEALGQRRLRFWYQKVALARLDAREYVRRASRR